MLSILFISCCVFIFGVYKVYGGWMERRLDAMDERLTPAHTRRDGVDFEPVSDAVVFGRHFGLIAGAGPIVGPIAAALVFGWGPALIWIVLAATFIGGVQGYTFMMASLRHKGSSFSQMGRKNMGTLTYRLFLMLILLVLIFVIIVFLDLTAVTFAPVTAGWGAGDSPAGRSGGAVATASVLYILLAVVLGRVVNLWKMPLRRATLLVLPLLFGGLWVGELFPLSPTVIPAFWGQDKNFWSLGLLIYCGVASLLPVGVLLRPRDYLSSVLLYACLLGGAIGLVVGSCSGTAAVTWPFFKAWSSPADGWLYPALCVMIAGGAVSGFHALCASGHTSKQLDKESSAKRVGLGVTLVEAALALLALATVMTLTEQPFGSPPMIFAGGLERFLAPLGIREGWVMSWTMLTVSALVLTTLDSCTRLSRAILQELTGLEFQTTWKRTGATLLVLLLPTLVVFRQIPGAGGTLLPVWKALWPVFGAASQLMGALALLLVYGWLRSQGKRALFVFIPMVFLFTMTLLALGQIVWRNFTQDGSWLVGGLSLGLAAGVGVVLVNMARHTIHPAATGRDGHSKDKKYARKIFDPC